MILDDGFYLLTIKGKKYRPIQGQVYGRDELYVSMPCFLCSLDPQTCRMVCITYSGLVSKETNQNINPLSLYFIKK